MLTGMDTQAIVSDLLLVLNQQAIADAIGVQQSTVSRWRNGIRERVSYETGEALIELRRKHARAIAKAAK